MLPNKGRIIGLTGTIGSGKSTVSGYLKEKGAFVVDADALSRQTMEKGQDGYIQCVAAFGLEILAENGEIDRKKLASIVFTNEKERLRLNGIVHPLVLRDMQNLTAKAFAQGETAVLWDVPLLFETNMDVYCDETWLVVSDEEICLARIQARDGMTREEALRRIRSQMPVKEKQKRATCLISNNAGLDELYAQSEKLWQAACLQAQENR